MILLENLFATLVRGKIPYAVLHSYENLPEKIVSDVDICIDTVAEKDLDKIIFDITSTIGTKTKITQKIFYGIPNLISYDIVNVDNLSKIAQLDFYRDNLGISWLSIPTNRFLNDRKKYKNFFVPTESKVFIYSLVKRTFKKQITLSQQKILKKLYLNNTQQIDVLVKRYFGLHSIDLLNKLIVSEKEDEKRNLLNKLRTAFIIRQFLIKPWKWPLIAYFFLVRVIQRTNFPTGILVCFVSPDGGGKSTIIQHVLNRLLCGVHKIRYIHWRPALLPQLRDLFHLSKIDTAITTPHSSNKRSKVSSFIRWLYYSFDYILGYYFILLPLKIKKTAILMDRYYYDIIVDPIRYGFNLPIWIFKSVLFLIPKPDLTIYLDNKPEELYKRKQELPVSELKRQVEAWREIIPSLPNARIVTTDKPLEDVVSEVTKLILERRAEMTRKMLKIDPDESKYLWKSEITNYIALPSKKNCRWIIPDNPRLAEKAFDLYLPYSTTGRIYKNLYRFFLSKGLLKYLKHKRLDLGLVDKNETLKTILVDLFKRDDLVLAVSTGTPGPFRKITAMVMDSEGRVLGIGKIGETPLAIERVKNESAILKVIGDRLGVMGKEQGNRSEVIGYRSEEHNIRIALPELLYEGEIGNAYVMIQSPAPFEGKSGGSEFNEGYANVLQILKENTTVKKKFIESEFYKKLKKDVENYPLSYRDIIQMALRHLEENIGDKEITFSLSHGDFAPWNMIWSKDGGQYFIFDWESATLEVPAGIDLIHFLFQTGFLLTKLRGKKLFNYILQHPFLSEYSFLPPDILLLFYCLHMAISEDMPQQLLPTAVERRRMIKQVIGTW